MLNSNESNAAFPGFNKMQISQRKLNYTGFYTGFKNVLTCAFICAIFAAEENYETAI